MELELLIWFSFFFSLKLVIVINTLLLLLFIIFVLVFEFVLIFEFVLVFDLVKFLAFAVLGELPIFSILNLNGWAMVEFLFPDFSIFFLYFIKFLFFALLNINFLKVIFSSLLLGKFSLLSVLILFMVLLLFPCSFFAGLAILYWENTKGVRGTVDFINVLFIGIND